MWWLRDPKKIVKEVIDTMPLPTYRLPPKCPLCGMDVMDRQARVGVMRFKGYIEPAHQWCAKHAE